MKRVAESRKLKVPRQKSSSHTVEKKPSLAVHPREQHQHVSPPVRCYNCNLFGHYIADCTKPRRQRGSCYSCGSVEHQMKNCCPVKFAKGSRGPIGRNVPNDATTLLVEKEAIKPDFMVPIKLAVSTGNTENLYVSINACLDTGSPISLR